MNRNNMFVLAGAALAATVIVCAGLVFLGAVIVFAANTSATEGQITTVANEAETEAAVLAIAAEYQQTGDLTTAQTRLAELQIPNSNQYLSFTLDQYIQEQRPIDDPDTQNLYNLAADLGATTTSIIAALATATPPPTSTPLPTATTAPTNTPSPVVPTDTPTPEPVAEEPTEEPTEEPEPTEEAEPTAVPATNTPAPPTNTPEPTATPEPAQPATDFAIVTANLRNNPQYNSCPGDHQIYVTVLDAAGNPLDGVTVVDTFGAVPPKVSGEKGPGKLEYDLWNNGFSITVDKKADGSPATSDVTPKLSSWDEDIPNEWLVESNYCQDMADCEARKSNNQLCRGHYSYDVIFQKTY